MTIFSRPFATEQAAQAAHPYNLFDPAAVYRTPDGAFVFGRLRCDERWGKAFLQEAAAKAKELTGNVMVSYRDPLLDIWKPIEVTP